MITIKYKKVAVRALAFLFPLSSFLFSSCSDQMEYKEYSIYDTAYRQKKLSVQADSCPPSMPISTPTSATTTEPH
jgi:hypothetical protein